MMPFLFHASRSTHSTWQICKVAVAQQPLSFHTFTEPKHMTAHASQSTLFLPTSRLSYAITLNKTTTWSNEEPGWHLAAAICASRVLRGEEHKVRVRPHSLLQLRHEELAVVIQQPAAAACINISRGVCPTHCVASNMRLQLHRLLQP